MGGFIVSRGDTAHLFDVIEEALDSVAVGVGVSVERALDDAVDLGGDDSGGLALGEIVEDGVGIVPPVGDEGLGRWSVLSHQIVISAAIAGLTGRQDKAEAKTIGGRADMDFGREATARAAKMLSISPLFAPAAC